LVVGIALRVILRLALLAVPGDLPAVLTGARGLGLALRLALPLGGLLAHRAQRVRVGVLGAVAVAGEVFVFVVGGGSAHTSMIPSGRLSVKSASKNISTTIRTALRGRADSRPSNKHPAPVGRLFVGGGHRGPLPFESVVYAHEVVHATGAPRHPPQVEVRDQVLGGALARGLGAEHIGNEVEVRGALGWPWSAVDLVESELDNPGGETGAEGAGEFRHGVLLVGGDGYGRLAASRSPILWHMIGGGSSVGNKLSAMSEQLFGSPISVRVPLGLAPTFSNFL